MLKAEGLGCRFGDRWLFRYLEIDLGVGDALVVTGRNGSGKSTLLKMLAGLHGASQGAIRRPERVGYSALDLALYGRLTSREHLTWAAEQRGRGSVDPVPYGLETDEQVDALSSGQRSRLRLALAEAHEPELLILDEPGVALDEAGIDLVEAVVVRQKARGALVIATNDPRERRFATHELAL